MVMFDTDVIIGALRGDAAAITAYHGYVGKEQIIISSFTWYELMVGCALRKNKELDEIVELLAEAGIMHIDDTVATVAAKLFVLLSKKGRPNDMADLFIAASCVVNDQTLVTRNIKHFKDIPGLQVESW